MLLDVAIRDRETQQLLGRMGRNAADLRPALRHVAEIMRGEQQARFATPSTFEPLRATTIARKRRAGNPEPEQPLVASGLLRRSLVHRDPNQISTLSRSSLLFGTRLHYARFQDPRQPVAISEHGRERAARTIRNWLLHGTPSDIA